MANNVYIGNRYVPVFADPVEWDSLRTYEALTIVTYLGTSYTSRKAVPAGIQLSNSEYWVVTGNYNAQVAGLSSAVETLTSDVNNLSDDVEELGGEITNLKIVNNVLDYGAKGDGVTDDTTAIQSAINSIPNGGTLYFPEGKYLVGNITYTYKIELAGAGMGKTILKHNTTGTMFKNLTNHALFSIHDMSIEGVYTNGVVQDDVCIEVIENTVGNDANDNYMLNIVPPTPHAQAKYNHFYNLFITRFGTGIFNFYYNFYTLMENINIYECKIGLRNVNTDSMFSNITIENCSEYGLWESGSANKWNNVKVTWCQSNNTDYGAIYISGNSNSMANIEAQENHHTGFYITGQNNQLVNCVSDGNNYANVSGNNYGFYVNAINYIRNSIVTARTTGNTIPIYIAENTGKGIYDIQLPTGLAGSNISTTKHSETVAIYVENDATQVTIEGNLITEPYRYLAMIHAIATNGSDVINNVIHVNCYGGTNATVVNAGGTVNYTVDTITNTNGRVVIKLSGMIKNTFNEFTVNGLSNVKVY